MKKIILIIIFILSVQIASALYGGESEVIYSFPECLNLTVKVNASLPIDDGEFSFLDCTEINQNQSYWFCNCYDNFNLTLITKLNTVNSYSFYILYYNQSGESTIILNGGGGGGGGTSCTPIWQCTVWTKCSQARTQTRTCTDNKNCRTTTGKPAEIRLCNYVPPKTTKTQEEEEPETPSGEGEPAPAEEPPVTGTPVTKPGGGFGGITGMFFQNITGANKWKGLGVIILVLVVGFGFYWFIYRKRRKRRIK